MDLYSLGMVAYEFALGRRLYRKQFPSIFDPYASKSESSTTMDERPKWMYWHTSSQMAVPKIKELIPEFPEDLSDLIAAMLAKPVRERIGSAEEALNKIGEVAPTGVYVSAEEKEAAALAAAPSKVNPLVLASIMLWVLAAVGLGGYMMWKKATTRPTITPESRSIVTDQLEAHVRGRIDDFPKNGSAQVIIKGGAVAPLTVVDDGKFTGTLRLGGVGVRDAVILVKDSNGAEVGQDLITLERTVPKAIKVTFQTNPILPATDFEVREAGKPNEPVKMTTDQNGQASVELAHGQFRIIMNHPRYRPLDVPASTGDDPTSTVGIFLNPLSEQVIADKRERLLSEMDSLVDRAANGDPDAIRRLEEIRKELAQLEPMSGDTDAANRVRLLQELDEATKRALAGDPEAARRVKEINEELRRLAGKGGTRSSIVGDPNAAAEREAKRTALVKEMNDLLDRAAAGDPAAIARLKEIQAELASLEAEDVKAGAGNDRRLALVREMAALADRAAAGDPAAIQRLREIRAELQQIADADEAKRSGKPVTSLFERREQLIRELGETISRSNSGDPSAYIRMREINLDLNALEKADPTIGAIQKRRKELIAELGQTIELAALGNADAKLRLVDIHRELATLSAIESAGGDSGKLAMAAARMMTGDPGLDMIDRGTLLGLTAEQFKAFLEINIPNGVLKVELVPHLTKIRLTGPVFNQEEYDRLIARLEPAMPRLQLEVRIDAWAVCRRLEDALHRLGAADVRVHAHLTYGDNAMFVQFKKTEQFTRDQVFVLARPFLLDRDMLRLQPM
jgi:hypothetical protein